jgi:hypothetical protein
MALTDKKVNESKVTALLLQRKVITEGQLKAAIDYQKSLGGQIIDILVKLDLVRASQIEEILKKVEGGTDGGTAPRGENVLDPASVKASDLKVHRRLLEKLPKDLVAEHQLIVFFPAANVGARKIILGHGTPITPAVEEKVRSVIGVDLVTLDLDPASAREILANLHRGEPQPRKPAAREKSFRSARPPGVDHEVVLTALLNVLVKRGLITAEELQIETELLQG